MALGYYDLAGKDIDGMISEMAVTDNNNPIVVFSRLFDYIEQREYDKVLCSLDTLHSRGYHSADIIREYISRRDEGVGINEILEYAASDDTGTDAAFFAVGSGLMVQNPNSIHQDFPRLRVALMSKIPFLYTWIGKMKYEETIRSEEPSGYALEAAE